MWDADFELLGGPRPPRSPAPAPARTSSRCGSSTRAPEEPRLHVVPALPAALDAALADAPAGRVFALPTYTALLELRAELARRGHVESFWSGPDGRRRVREVQP